MNMLPDEAIKEFQQIYKKVFKKEIPSEDARKKAENLIGLFRIVYESPKKNR